MGEDEIIIEQPAKKRKLHNSSSTEIECDVAVTNTESQDLEDVSIGLTKIPIDSTTPPSGSLNDLSEVTKEPNLSPRDPESTQDPNESLKEQNTEQSTSVSQDKCRNLVTTEEVHRLRQFDVLDEVKSNDEDSNEENSDDSDGKSVELPDEEIDQMLEADLPDAIKGAPKTRARPFITRQKIVLEEKGVNHFEILPLDWIMVRHSSGMPIYMHRFTRVCTLSKPYFLGQNNTRRHDIPISAIPCFAYRRALQEEEEKQKEIDKKIEEQYRNVTWPRSTETDLKTEFNGTDSKPIFRNGSSGPGVASSSKCVFVCPITVSPTGQHIQEFSRQTLASTQRDQPNNNQRPRSPVEKKFEPTEHLTSASTTHRSSESVEQQTSATSGQHTDSSANLMSDMFREETALIKEEIIQGTSESACPFSNGTLNGESPNDKGEGSNVPPTVKREVPLSRQPVILPGGIIMPPPRVETINTSWKTQHLTPEQINKYCKNLFKFKTVNIMHFKRWADRRKYTKARKTLQYPTLPEGTKLITIPAQPSVPGQENGGKSNKRDWVMNMNDRSYLSVFHEYVGRALQKQPIYHFRQLENAAQPYQAIVYIGGMQYGVGYGSSKRQAKSAAARASIHILIPEMKDELDAGDPRNSDKAQPDFHDFFDLVGIEDPRITEFCSATCEPSPYAILRTCLLRNFGAGDRHIHTEMKKLEYQKIELTMKVGKHTATVICKNKKTAKQRASQSILQALHPHVRSWGSLLRLYGSKSMKSCKEKKLEEQQITLLQDKARHNEPNYAVLDKLRLEMGKLRARDAAVVPIGTLLLREDLPTHSASNLNNLHL